MTRISVGTEEGPWQVDGELRTTFDGALMLARGELGGVSTAEMSDLFDQYRDLYGTSVDDSDLGVVVFAADDAYLDVDGPVETISFCRHAGAVCLRVDNVVPWPDEDDEIPAMAETTRRTVTPLLNARQATLVSCDIDAYGSTAPVNFVGISVIARPTNEVAELSELYELGEAVERLLTSYVGRAPSRVTTADLIRGGHADLLIGQPERSWLDVKSAEYMLNTPRGKFSLAIEVAAFCNGEDGGVLLFGAATETPDRHGGEVVSAVDGLDAVRFSTRQYLDIISAWVYPFPLGLQVEQITLPNGQPAIMVEIPAQPDEFRPFLVSGATKVDDDAKVDREAITVPQRRGEDTARLTASMLHAQLAAGRAYLRGRPQQALSELPR